MAKHYFQEHLDFYLFRTILILKYILIQTKFKKKAGNKQIEQLDSEDPLPKEIGTLTVCVVYNVKKGLKTTVPDVEAEYDNIETIYAIKSALEAVLTKEQETEITKMSRRIYHILGCRDFSRIDFRMSAQGKIYFIEINPLPGLAPGYSDYPMLAEFCGMNYTELVNSILKAAVKRLQIRTEMKYCDRK